MDLNHKSTLGRLLKIRIGKSILLPLPDHFMWASPCRLFVFSKKSGLTDMIRASTSAPFADCNLKLPCKKFPPKDIEHDLPRLIPDTDKTHREKELKHTEVK